MHRAIPVGNKLLSKKWDEQNQAVHYEKLRTIRSQVDSATPATFSQQPAKAKKDQILEDRYTEIERENRLLLEKMSNIMQSRTSRTRSVKKRSLNKESRKREQIKISVENQALLRRLQERQPNYNTQKWEIERRRTERMLQNICQYPYQLGVTDEVVHRRFCSTDTRPDSLSQTLNPTTSHRPKTRKLNPLHRDESGEVVYKRGVNVANKYFLVEITMKTRMMVIKAYDIESPDSYVMQLDHDSAAQLIGSDRKYEKIVELLVFENGELRLLDPRDLPQSRPHNRITPVRPVRPPNSSNPRPNPRHIRQISHGAAEPSTEAWDLPATQRKAATPQAAQLERISEISVSPLANTAKIDMQKVMETPQGPESLFDFEKVEVVAVRDRDSGVQTERRLDNSGDEYAEDEQWGQPEEAKVEGGDTETAEMKQESEAGVAALITPQPLEEAKERHTATSSDSAGVAATTTPQPLEETKERHSATPTSSAGVAAMIPSQPLEEAKERHSATPTHFDSAEEGRQVRSDSPPQELPPTVQEAFNPVPVPEPSDTRVEPVAETPAKGIQMELEQVQEKPADEQLPPVLKSFDDASGMQETVPPLTVPRDTVFPDYPAATETTVAPVAAVLSLEPSNAADLGDAGNPPPLTEDIEAATAAAEESKVPSAEVDPGNSETADNKEEEKVQTEDFVEQQPAEAAAESAPKEDDEKSPSDDIPQYNGAVEGEEKESEGPQEQSQNRELAASSPSEPLAPAVEGGNLAVEPQNEDRKGETVVEEAKVEERKSEGMVEKSEEPAEGIDTIPADAVPRTDTAPKEAVEKPDTALVDTIEKSDMMPADVVVEAELAPADSLEKTDSVPVDTAEKADIAPTDAVEKTDIAPVDAVEKADVAPAEEPDVALAAALEKTEAEPVRDEEFKAEEKTEVVSPIAAEATQFPEPPAEPQHEQSESSIPEIKRSNVVDLPSPLQQPQEASLEQGEAGLDGSETHEENVTTVAAAAEFHDGSASPELETVTLAQEAAKSESAGDEGKPEEHSSERSGQVGVEPVVEESKGVSREEAEGIAPEETEKSMPEPPPQAEVLEDVAPAAPEIESSGKAVEPPPAEDEALPPPETVTNIPEPTEAIDAENPAPIVPQSHDAEEQPPATEEVAEEGSNPLPSASADPTEQAMQAVVPETSEPQEAQISADPPLSQDSATVPAEQAMEPPLVPEVVPQHEQGGDVEGKPPGEQDNGEEAAGSD